MGGGGGCVGLLFHVLLSTYTVAHWCMHIHTHMVLHHISNMLVHIHIHTYIHMLTIHTSTHTTHTHTHTPKHTLSHTLSLTHRGYREVFNPHEPNFPRFTSWLGHNSTQGKQRRLLGEIHTRMWSSDGPSVERYVGGGGGGGGGNGRGREVKRERGTAYWERVGVYVKEGE